MEKITKYTYALIDEKTKKIIEFIEVENNNFDIKSSVNTKNSMSNSNYLNRETENKMKNIEIFIEKNNAGKYN